MKSSALVMIWEMSLRTLVLAWTWRLKLPVMSAKLSSERPTPSKTMRRLVLTLVRAPLALVMAALALSRVAARSRFRLVGMSHSPSDPLGSRRLAVMAATSAAAGRMPAAMALRLEVSWTLLERVAAIWLVRERKFGRASSTYLYICNLFWVF